GALMTMPPTEQVTGQQSGITWDLHQADYERAGLRLHYLDARRASASPGRRAAVLLHGMTSHGDSWRPVISRMVHTERVICPDFRGHGFSDWTRDGYWLKDYATDVLALIDRLDLTEVDLLGHSLGARVSMVLAPMLGDRLRSWIISDTGPEVSRAAAQQALSINASAKSVPGFRDIEKLKDFLRSEQPLWVEEAIELRAQKLYRENWVGMLVNRGDTEVTWLLGRPGLVEKDDMWAGLRNTNVPTLILKANNSFLLDDELTSRMLEALARGAARRFDVGHYLPYEDPDGVTAAIDEFFHEPAATVSSLTPKPTE
ncbi:MAG: alpha/beta fold hydrolase, partial [Acidimicrobiia bacterium]